MRKKLLTIAALSCMALALAGCEKNTEVATEATTTAEAQVTTEEVTDEATEEAVEGEEEVDDEENYDTGDASADDPRNGDDIGEKEILVVSFGTSFNDSRRLTIGNIEKAIEDAYPDYSVRRAFTSQIIIDHVNDRDGVKIDNVKEALDRASDNGVKELVVVPTHLMNGLEYNDLVDEIGEYSDAFDVVKISDPLLTDDSDFDAVAEAIHKATESYDDGKTAICFMGHGTEADSNSIYSKMQETFKKKGYDNYYMGTVEATPSLDDVIALVKKGDYKKVVLQPLMVVAGDHANNDMAGDEDDSWKSTFESEGYDVECILEGLGQNDDVVKIYLKHVDAAINK